MTQYSHHEIYDGGESRWETNSSFPSWLSRFPPAAHRSVSHRARGRQTYSNNVKEWRYVCLYVTDSVLTPDRSSVRTKSSDCSDSTLPVWLSEVSWGELRQNQGGQLENPRRRTKTTTAFPNTCSDCRAPGRCMIFVAAQIFTVWVNILLQDTNCYRVCTTWIYFP